MALEQEKRVGEEINALFKLARDNGDYRAEQFMQWFVKEQVEEVALMTDLLNVVERSADNLLLVEEYIAREGLGGEGDDPTAPRRGGRRAVATAGAGCAPLPAIPERSTDHRWPERDGYIPGVPCWVDTSQPDPAAAVDFYSGLFGWEFEDVMPPDVAGQVLHRAASAAATSPRSGRSPEGAPPMAMWNTYVWVDSADETASKVLDAGGTV